MPRPIRVEFPGAVYHVMARGNERKDVYRDDQDRQRFLDALAATVEQFGLRVYAYCLMPNHYHLLLGTPRGNLSRAMAWLQTTYTTRFNARHRRRGHLFQGRFKAQLVEADEYGQWLVQYVHLNPVRPAKKSDPIAAERWGELARYAWSSHRDYGGWRTASPAWLCLDWLAYWGRSRRAAQTAYRRTVRGAFGQAVKNPWERLRRGLVLGGEELYARAYRLMKQKGGLEEARWTESEAVAAVRARVRLGNERGIAVAREYGYRDGSGITQVIKRLEAAARVDKELAKRLGHLASASSASNKTGA
jgi:REP element-mobilizing transposase RayT